MSFGCNKKRAYTWSASRNLNWKMIMLRTFVCVAQMEPNLSSWIEFQPNWEFIMSLHSIPSSFTFFWHPACCPTKFFQLRMRNAFDYLFLYSKIEFFLPFPSPFIHWITLNAQKYDFISIFSILKIFVFVLHCASCRLLTTIQNA